MPLAVGLDYKHVSQRAANVYHPETTILQHLFQRFECDGALMV
jgi:hypothetical protein